MIIHNDKNYKEPSPTGRYAPDILCKNCDNVLGRYENSAFITFKALRSVKISKIVGGDVIIDSKAHQFRVQVENEIVRFACGILWKYASIPRNIPGFIDIGKYLKMCEGICFDGADIPPGIDVFIERDISAHVHKLDATEVYYYSTPSVGILGERRMAWFNAGGFFVYVRIDDEGPSKFATKRCWLKNRKNCYFNVNLRALQHFEEIRRSMVVAQPHLARLNKKLNLQLKSISYKVQK